VCILIYQYVRRGGFLRRLRKLFLHTLHVRIKMCMYNRHSYVYTYILHILMYSYAYRRGCLPLLQEHLFIYCTYVYIYVCTTDIFINTYICVYWYILILIHFYTYAGEDVYVDCGGRHVCGYCSNVYLHVCITDI